MQAFIHQFVCLQSDFHEDYERMICLQILSLIAATEVSVMECMHSAR